MRAISAAPQQAAGAQLEVLWTGDDARAGAALTRLGMRVRRARPDQCLQLVASRAPDVLVLSAGAAARADAIVRELRTRQPGATLPVIVISDQAPVAQGHGGLVARISAELARSTLAAVIQERVAAAAALSRLRELTIAPEELDAWLRTAVEEESAGFLLTGAGVIAVGPGGRLAPNPAQLRHALEHVREGAASAVKLLELPANRLLVSGGPLVPVAAVELSGAQIVVIHPDLDRGTELCCELVGAGALAQSVGVEPADIARVAGVAPTLIVIAAAALQHPSAASLWQDARLASVSWFVLDESRDASLSPGQILAPLAALIGAGRPVRERLAQRELVVDRIESFGAAGWLREVGRCEPPLTLVLKSASGRSEVSLAGGKIRGASFVPAEGGAPQQGQAALQASLAMSFGRVLVGPHDAVIAHETSLYADQDPVLDDGSEEPAASEIRERRAEPQLAEPSATAPHSFRPSKPGQLGAKAKAPAVAASVLPLRTTGTTSAPASVRVSKDRSTRAAISVQASPEPSAPHADPAPAPVQPEAREEPAADAAQPAPILPPPEHEAPAASAAHAPPSPQPPQEREEPAASAAAPAPTPQPHEEREEPAPRAPEPPPMRPPRAQRREPAANAPEPPPMRPPRAQRREPAANAPEPPPMRPPRAQREEPATNAPQPPPLRRARTEREDHAAPQVAPVAAQQPVPSVHPDQRVQDDGTPAPLVPQRVAFDVALARGVASAPGVRSRPPLPVERVEQRPDRAGELGATPPTSPAPRLSAPPPLQRRRELLDPFAPLPPELFAAPIAPIASALEPPPSLPLPAQPEAPPPARPSRSSRVLVFGGAAAAIGLALLANGLTGVGGDAAVQPSEPAARVEVASSSPAPHAQPTAPGALASTRHADRHAAPPPAPGELRPTPIPRGSEAAELMQQAKRARDDSHPKQAEALLSEVLARYPNDFGAIYHMALTLVRMRRFEEAHAQLSKAIALNSESASAWLLEGDIFLQEGRRRDALRAWNRCLAAQADFPSCKERLARWRLR